MTDQRAPQLRAAWLAIATLAGCGSHLPASPPRRELALDGALEEQVTRPPSPSSEGDRSFDRGAAGSALATAAKAAKSCKTDATSTGHGTVKLAFSPKGDVTSLALTSGPWADTPVAACITSAFRSARVPPFDGEPIAVTKSFSIE